ncbi:carbohydrate-binding protein [Streptomyces sp. NPDC018031]|uniref:carbohydrate-binding protein n=1 Tax=Streptomyces sp. NPDC018031 TaxID=3365033 RepID=UPI0037A7CEDF
MTAGNNGPGTPENDDPFAYLYRQEGEQPGQSGQAGPTGTAAPRTGGYGYPGPGTPHQPGVPRTSYNHVRAVGERSYGGQQSFAGQQGHPAPAQPGQGQPGYGQQQGYGPGAGQPGYGRQNAHYAAPETLPGGAPRRPAGAPSGRGAGSGGGRGPNVKGLLIGAIAVVAVVVAGIGAALLTNGSGDGKEGQADQTATPSAGTTVEPTEPKSSSKPGKPKPLPTQDASALTLAGGAATASDIEGAKAEDGTYVGGINTPGASATWSVNVDKAGTYKLYVGYGVPGEDQSLSLSVNSGENRALNMANFALAKKGDWTKGWTHTYAIVELNKGTNTVVISCQAGDKCQVNLDQVWLKK